MVAVGDFGALTTDTIDQGQEKPKLTSGVVLQLHTRHLSFPHQEPSIVSVLTCLGNLRLPWLESEECPALWMAPMVHRARNTRCRVTILSRKPYLKCLTASYISYNVKKLSTCIFKTGVFSITHFYQKAKLQFESNVTRQMPPMRPSPQLWLLKVILWSAGRLCRQLVTRSPSLVRLSFRFTGKSWTQKLCPRND